MPEEERRKKKGRRRGGVEMSLGLRICAIGWSKIRIGFLARPADSGLRLLGRSTLGVEKAADDKI